jgi:flagellar protein FliO/FliZ
MMQFLTSLFGETGNAVITTALALGIVLVLIVLGLWVLKLTMKSTSTLGRGRARRLTVVDQLQVDSRRQLLIVRRDDVEHLILTGGPQDLLLETGIEVQRPAAPTKRPGSMPESTESPAPASAPRSQMEKLKEMAGPDGPRRPRSLRHTGLLRPISTMEPAKPMAGDNSGRFERDSATRPTSIEDKGRSGLGTGLGTGFGATPGASRDTLS